MAFIPSMDSANMITKKAMRAMACDGQRESDRQPRAIKATQNKLVAIVIAKNIRSQNCAVMSDHFQILGAHVVEQHIRYFNDLFFTIHATSQV